MNFDTDGMRKKRSQKNEQRQQRLRQQRFGEQQQQDVEGAGAIVADERQIARTETDGSTTIASLPESKRQVFEPKEYGQTGIIFTFCLQKTVNYIILYHRKRKKSIEYRKKLAQI